MGACTPGFDDTIATLRDSGIDCATAPAVVSFRSPFGLVNWTLPLVELLMVGLAVVALVHAWTRWRRRNDPTNLAVWSAALIYVLVLEPPLYFPDRFGLQDQVGLVFVHNLFSVNFLFDRLPLYIIAIYPAQVYLAYALVQRTGILERRNPLLGAAAVGLTYQAFYEVFDHIGPQLQWWAWNPGAPSNGIMVGSVPLSSAAVFGAASPFGFTLLALLLLRRRTLIAVRTVLVGVLSPILMTVLALPYGIFGPSALDNRTGQAAGLWFVIGVIAVLGVVAFARTWTENGGLPGAGDPPGFLTAFAPVAGTVYLVLFAVFWVTALPDFLDAAGGLTPQGTPTGNLPYAILCGLVATAITVLAARSRLTPVPEPAREAEPQPLR